MISQSSERNTLRGKIKIQGIVNDFLTLKKSWVKKSAWLKACTRCRAHTYEVSVLTWKAERTRHLKRTWEPRPSWNWKIPLASTVACRWVGIKHNKNALLEEKMTCSLINIYWNSLVTSCVHRRRRKRRRLFVRKAGKKPPTCTRQFLPFPC